jgi:hypothetical protein
MTTTWGVVFGDGWNGSLINPLTRAEAAARDAAHEPYAAVLLDDGHVRAEIRVGHGPDKVDVVCYDGRGRVRALLEFRPTPDGALALWSETTWDGPESMTDEQFARTAARETTTWQPGENRTVHQSWPQGDADGSHTTTGSGAAPRFPRPAFGEWSPLLERAGVGWVELAPL